MNLIKFILRHSAACTIMNKMKFRSRAQVFKHYGFSLKVPSSNFKGFEEFSS